MAHAKGLRDRRVMTMYAGRNAILPPLTGFAAQFGAAVGGLVFIEFVFSYPGVGLTLQQAALGSDYPLTQALAARVRRLRPRRQPDHGRALRRPRPARARELTVAVDPIAFPLPDAPRSRLSLAGVGAPPPDQPEVVLRHRRLRRHRPRRAAGAGDRAEPAGRDRRAARPVAEQGVLVRHDRPGLRRLRAGDLGSADLARRRLRSGGDLDDDRGNARHALRLRRRVGRRRDQHGDQHLHRHPGAAAADRRLLVPADAAGRCRWC